MTDSDSTYGDGLYAKVAEKIRDVFIPAHPNQDFDSAKVVKFFSWDTFKDIKDEAGKDVDKVALKLNTAKALGNFCVGKTPSLKRIGRRGFFRAIDYDLQTMNLREARGAATLDLRWPFALERYVLLYPGNLAVVAGTSNSGKSAFVNGFIAANQWRHETHLFSSDMVAEELADRLEPFDFPEDAPIWDNCHERVSDFADVIKPDCINVVDYVEYVENVVEIKQEVEEMYRRMQGGRGMCLITIQKKGDEKNVKGQTIKHPLGYGGATILSRPRLYLTLDPVTMMIYKSKKRAQREVNPNGKTWKYALVEGARFVSVVEIDNDGNDIGQMEPEVEFDGEPELAEVEI